MRGTELLTLLIILSVAFLASAATPRAGHNETGLFGRKSARLICPAGQRYSSFYRECTRGWTQVSSR